MDAETLTALKQSIEKWERNAVAETPYDFLAAIRDCALCGLFFYGDCLGRPVMAETGQPACDGTPYCGAAYAKHEWLADPSSAPLRDAAHAAARAEVEFLRSLLPEEETTS